MQNIENKQKDDQQKMTSLSASDIKKALKAYY